MNARALLAMALVLALATSAAQARQTPPAAPATTSAAASAVPAAVAAAPVVAAPARTVAPVNVAGPSAGNLLQTIFALLFVLGLLAVFAWVMKRYGPRHSVGSANVRLVGALNLGARERIVVVEVGEQWIVVGASPGRMNALATMPKQEGAAPLVAPQLASGSFAEWLKQTIDKRNAN